MSIWLYNNYTISGSILTLEFGFYYNVFAFLEVEQAN